MKVRVAAISLASGMTFRIFSLDRRIPDPARALLRSLSWIEWQQRYPHPIHYGANYLPIREPSSIQASEKLHVSSCI